METLHRVLRNVPFLVLLLLVVAAPLFAQAPAAPARALPPKVTPKQAEALIQAVRSGAPLPAEMRKLLEEHPELKEQLPPEIREKLEKGQENGEAEAAKKEAAAQGQPMEQAALRPYDWRSSVYVSGLFSGRLNDNEVRTLGHFGHEIFAPRPGGASILENLPVSPGYLIGPGDEVVVRLWGRMEGTHRMVVDRDGKIYFPKIGSLYVAGKTFDELKSFLRAKVGTIAEVSSDVTLGQMKGVRVSVVGDVRAPGWYNVSSLHTVLQVLYLAGGVKDIGSLRRVELRRGGKTVETIDLYDVLLSGDTRADTRIAQGDSVFVPVVGTLVALTGEVRRPAIYELKQEKTLPELLTMAGGFAPTAYKRRVQVERLEGHFAKVVLDVDAEEVEQGGKPFDLADGDIVRVLPIVLTDVNTVRLEGNVYRPGRYELKSGMTVKDLLPDETRFLPGTYFDYALLTRLVPPEMRKETIPVDLRAIVLEQNRAADIALKPYDNLMVFTRDEFKDLPKVNVSGEVRRPGTFELKEGARISDLVKVAGDLTKLAYQGQAEVVRVDEKRAYRTLYVDLGKAMAGIEQENLLLEDEDQLFIRRIPDGTDKVSVVLAGEIRFAGAYVVNKGERLSSLIARAGGFTEDAHLLAAQFTRVSTQKSQQEAIDKLIEELEVEIAQKAQGVSGALDREDIEANREVVQARKSLVAQLQKARAKGRVVIRLEDVEKIKGTSADILLEDGDRLEVPKKTNVVNVVGRVYNPTGVVYDPAHDTLGHYLQTVGGPTESADRSHIFLVKANGSVVTKDNVGESFFLFGGRGIESAKVEPGDSIVVPEKLVQTRLMKDVKDITQILYQVAVTAGVLIVLF